MATQELPAIRVDEATGQKLFNTRAKIASERVKGQGYDIVTNQDYLACLLYTSDAADD